MTVLYLDCTHGARKDAFAEAVAALLPADAPERAQAEDMLRSAREEHAAAGGHGHHTIEEVHAAIDAAGMGHAATEAAYGVYGILARAEGAAHGVDAADVHFHEVGDTAAVRCVCAACAAASALDAERVVASPVCTGFGFVDCAHGRLSIPAPATKSVLEGAPAFAGDAEGELATPTGAALVRYFAQGFADEPPAGAMRAVVG